MATLTRDDLAEIVRRKNGLSRTESRELVDLVLEVIVQALERGEDVKLTNFCIFKIRDKRERVGRNPRTGEAATISARKSIIFRASPKMKLTVEGG